MGKLPDEDSSDYLSGLLMGAEIEEARRLFLNAEPYVAGAETLVGRYLAAFAALGLQAPRRAAEGRRPRPFRIGGRRRIGDGLKPKMRPPAGQMWY
jgi:hypothetical protein